MTNPVNLQPYAYYEGNPTHMPVAKHSYMKVYWLYGCKTSHIQNPRYSDHSAAGRQPRNLHPIGYGCALHTVLKRK